MEAWYYYVALAAVGFLVGFLNTLAGGGSLLSLPILIFLGLPPSVANGTNRIAVLVQGIANVAGYKSKGIEVSSKFIWFLSLAAAVGTVIGSKLALEIDDKLFNRILAVVMLLMVLLMIFQPKTPVATFTERLTGKFNVWGFVAFFFIGIYGGFIQAGTGIFMLLALSSINRISLMKSNVIKAVVMLAYTVVAVIFFGLSGKLNWEIGLTLASGQALGGWITSRWSVNKGDGIVKILMIVVIAAMSVKLWFFN
ncbi:sulfite exporter TauE/SafE family protein [Arenibacter sp. GZD96]|uniref:sulfite exporter TauE/SafE family protein n=1 Tax=Aurantibrevibacter litoralis TaxID=3106030 RepID=UPI002AFEF84A|nr:sulfite exporter TauE/SafE family protein [Arenibacter sp. GZD-96]MEA1786300.1 sulfite exporter TauE/SafE family protein [Arenibacter sp. GZD-96]